MAAATSFATLRETNLGKQSTIRMELPSELALTSSEADRECIVIKPAAAIPMGFGVGSPVVKP